MSRFFIVIALCCVAMSANAVEFAVGANGGTPGVGLNATLGVTENVNLRGVFNFFNYDFDENEDGVDYELDFDLSSLGALVDWHPMGGSFRVSAGIFANGNDISGTGRGQTGTQVEFGDMVFDADDIGTVNASIEFDGAAPYVGVGWGNSVGEGRWTFMVDLGVFLQGEPDVSLTTPEVDPIIAAQVETERAQAQAELEDDVDGFELFPYVSFGFGFKL